VNTVPPPTPLGKTATSQPSLTFTRTPLPTYEPPITPSPTMTLGPTPTLMGGGYSQIAFASDRTGLPQIYLMNFDGSDSQQLTNMSGGACQPAWSPDGARLVFISPCQKRADQYPAAMMYVINADGTGVDPLATGGNGDFDPAWSPDGSRIAFTSLRDGSRQIYVLNLDDNSVTPLTEASGDVRKPDWSLQPAWSPSGMQIVYTGHAPLTNTLQIWVMSDTGSSPMFLIPRGPTYWNFLPDWSPDGKTILFSETIGDQQLGWLMLFDYEHQTADAVHLRMQAYGTHSDYSPDGIWVTYESTDIQDSERHDYDIYLVKADGTGIISRLTDAITMEFDAAWRPMFKP
jgi:Tol biopolymer transport system component